jgi:hypothetical protein
MRCPYCGGLNTDRAPYCVNCGRDLIARAPKQNQQNQPTQPGYRQTPPYQQPRPGAMPQGRPGPAAPPPPNQPPYTQPSSYAPQTPPLQRPQVPGARQSAPPRPAATPVPAPVAPSIAPAPFPPRTATQLCALEPAALPYSVLESKPGDGRKKIVRIAYARCAPWQQVATLLKAFKEQQEARFDTIIVQGVLDSNADVYSFTNGQLYYDRNVRLGSQTTNRYQIETGNGFESDSVRIVINE